MTEPTWDELDNQIDLFMAKIDSTNTTLSGSERGLIVGNLRGFCSQLREWGFMQPHPKPHREDCPYPCCD